MNGPGRPRTGHRTAAALGAAALVLASGLATGLAFVLVSRFGAGPSADEATLPPVSAAELIASVRSARPASLAGTVHLDERLGLLTPGRGAVLARLWSDGEGRRRISLPEPEGERTIVDDGVAVWSWDSATRSVSRSPVAPDGPLDPFQTGEMLGNPAETAASVLRMVEPESTARVDPPATVAGRPTYQLVLTPVPTERTLLREIRLAVDGQTRLPLELSVMTNGSATPALRVGFSSVRIGPQEPALFRFTPAPGVRVTESTTTPGAAAYGQVTLLGRGWDTVLVRRLPRRATGGPVFPPAAADLVSDAPASGLTAETPISGLVSGLAEGPLAAPIASPISGPWGHGQLVSTPIGTAVLTSDGRLVAGAVPAQVLTEALAP